MKAIVEGWDLLGGGKPMPIDADVDPDATGRAAQGKRQSASRWGRICAKRETRRDLNAFSHRAGFWSAAGLVCTAARYRRDGGCALGVDGAAGVLDRLGACGRSPRTEPVGIWPTGSSKQGGRMAIVAAELLAKVSADTSRAERELSAFSRNLSGIASGWNNQFAAVGKSLTSAFTITAGAGLLARRCADGGHRGAGTGKRRSPTPTRSGCGCR